ncbi:hypothetical protein CETAM_10230 [Corynebacterium comes]|uniref:DUF262 domain-containing protein n=1 Tax=Corynebacterium comes TaxID=2675218 RepID=A0A6B8W1L5_9CORY|nr:hypothetical protein CETAM_10230 [Corynebacterium comes]
MKGSVKSAYTIFDSAEKSIIIPVYQRNYDWTRKQCERLFDDLENAIRENRPKHFFGAVVGDPETSFKWIVIDGQQRLTTLSLLMLALSRSIDSRTIATSDPELASRIQRSYLKMSHSSDEVKFKLKPVKNDNLAYYRLFGDEKHFIEDSNLTSNYRYFLDRLAKTNLTGEEVWNAIERLELMILDLESHDDPQRIFESLNSTGLALSEADKIRNLVLMGLDHQTQERLYENYWNATEINVGYRTDWFIRWYLTIRLSRTPNQNAVYDEFKGVLARAVEPVEIILRDLHDYSAVFREIDTPDTGNVKLDRILDRFNLIRGDVLLPLVLPLYREFKEGQLSVDEFARIIRVLETHTFRRTISSVNANALNKIYATMYNEIRKLRRDGDGTWDVLVHLLRRRDDTSGRIPDDNEFGEAFASRNMYRMNKNMHRYMFDVLENGDSNDTKDIVTALENQIVSIEHVMPQTLTAQWRDELGGRSEEIHRSWVNRIGNLTVTGYNSSYSNLPFIQKRDRENGFRETPYRLNRDIRDRNRWDEEAMQERTRALLDAALSYWELPATDYEPKKNPPLTEPLGEETQFTGRVVTAFEYGGVKVPVWSWSELMPKVIQMLLDEHRSEIVNYAQTIGGLIVLIQGAQDLPRGIVKIDEALAVNIANDTFAKTRELRRLMGYLELDTDDLVFTLRREKADIEEQGREVQQNSPLHRLLVFEDMVEEVASQNVTPADTESLRQQFVEIFTPLRPSDPVAALAGKDLQSLKTAEGVADATTEQVLAAMALTMDTPVIYAPHALHDSMVAGEFSLWLGRLEELAAR